MLQGPSLSCLLLPMPLVSQEQGQRGAPLVGTVAVAGWGRGNGTEGDEEGSERTLEQCYSTSGMCPTGGTQRS